MRRLRRRELFFLTSTLALLLLILGGFREACLVDMGVMVFVGRYYVALFPATALLAVWWLLSLGRAWCRAPRAAACLGVCLLLAVWAAAYLGVSRFYNLYGVGAPPEL